MTLKRRSFLTLMGGSAFAPFLPRLAARRALGARAAAGYAGYNKLLFGLATHHAQTAGTISASGLSARLGVTLSRARGLMQRMTLRGVLVPATDTAEQAGRALRQVAKMVDTSDRGTDESDTGNSKEDAQ